MNTLFAYHCVFVIRGPAVCRILAKLAVQSSGLIQAADWYDNLGAMRKIVQTISIHVLGLRFQALI